MKSTQLIMGMPITVEVVDSLATAHDIDSIFSYFVSIDERFSTYKKDSEVSKINRHEISSTAYSQEMKTILALCQETKKLSNGFFDIEKPDGSIDPSGLVKGWAINEAAKLLRQQGFKNFYVEAGGDIQVSGANSLGNVWAVGIQNPFKPSEIVKAIELADKGMATSGTYVRGQHIYNPHNRKQLLTDIVSMTVIGPNVYEADRFATAAFAMGKDGIYFIEKLDGFEGYMIDKDQVATQTTGFGK